VEAILIVRAEDGRIFQKPDLDTLYERLPKTIGDAVTSVEFRNGVPRLLVSNGYPCAIHFFEITLSYHEKKMRLLFDLDFNDRGTLSLVTIELPNFQEGIFRLIPNPGPPENGSWLLNDRWRKVETAADIPVEWNWGVLGEIPPRRPVPRQPLPSLIANTGSGPPNGHFEIAVDRSGAVTQVKTISAASRELERLAVDLRGKWSFDPAADNGTPVPVTVHVGLQTELPELDINYAGRGTTAPPKEFRYGTGTLDQAKAWVTAVDGEYLPPEVKTELRIEERDLDLDGSPDVLIALVGWGRFGYRAFLRTPTGLQYIGGFPAGLIRSLPAEGDEPVRCIIRYSLGAGLSFIELAELRPDGLHRRARASLAAGDGGTPEGNRLANALMESKTVSRETLQRVFGDRSH
jgi:hypothetical protein